MLKAALDGYEGEERGAAWARQQAQWGNSQAELFITNFAGELPAAFADCMSHIGEIFDMVESVDLLKTPPGRTVIGVVGYSYQLLVSAWADIAAGRLVAAYDHMRSIFEAPDYVLALAWDADFRTQWRDQDILEKKKAARAMKIARDGFNKNTGVEGDKRYAQRINDRKPLQVFAHVSTWAVGGTLLQPPGVKGGRFVIPQGTITPYNTEAAVYLVVLAKEILVALAFSDLLPDDWKDECGDTLAKVQPYLRGLNEAFQQQN